MAVQLGRRLVWLSVITLLLLAALGGRLYTLEVARSTEYTRKAVGVQTESVSLGMGRGQILDRNGKPLTDPQPFWGVAVFPALMPPDPTDAQLRAEATALAAALGVPGDQVLRWVQKSGAAWLSLDGSGDPLQLTAAQKTAVQELGLPGVVVWRRAQRYGDHALARQLVGYLNDDGPAGGLEKALNAELTGPAAPRLTAFRDGLSRPLGAEAVRMTLPTAGKAPYDVITTIDGQIQQAVEQVLDKHDAHAGAAAVVLDPGTGEVLAMASRPQFRYGQAPAGGEALNRAITKGPPGSVFKAITAAAALEQHAVRPDEQFQCSKELNLGATGPKKAAGPSETMTFRQATAKSCNDVFLQVGRRLGVPAMLKVAQAFGFGARTVTLAPNRPWDDESAGGLPDPADYAAVQMAFGQGALDVTPLQVARAYAAIANDGKLPTVQLIKAVKSPAGEVMARPPAGQSEQVISEETARTLQDLLHGVTDPGGVGSGKAAWIPGAGSAGKTGSAEITTGHPEITDAWFAGWFPLRRPRYVVVVRVERGGAGGAVAAPIFQEIGTAILAIKGY